MNIIPVVLYTLKVNMFLVIVRSCRSSSLLLSHLDSSLFAATQCTQEPEFPDPAFVVNVTEVPI